MLKLGFKTHRIVFIVSLVVLFLANRYVQFPIFWMAIPVLIFGVNVVVGCIYVQSQFFIKTFNRSDSSNGIALTFDDGPHELWTPKILSILKEFDAVATFFVIGENVVKHPQLVQRIHQDGHQIGNHSTTHPSVFAFMPVAAIILEMRKTNKAVKEIIGLEMRWFRPPFGVLSPRIAKACRALNFKVIGWSIRSFDTKKVDVSVLSDRIISQVSGGKIILFHDRMEQTCDTLRETLLHCRNNGISIVSIEEMIKQKAYE